MNVVKVEFRESWNRHVVMDKIHVIQINYRRYTAQRKINLNRSAQDILDCSDRSLLATVKSELMSFRVVVYEGV